MDNERIFPSPVVTAYPTSDGLVFADNELGNIFERRGIITMFHDGNLREDVFYADEYGSVYGNREEGFTVWERYTLIGRVGDTIVPKRLESAILANTISNNTGVDDIFNKAEKYFTIDKTKAEDTLKVRLGLYPYDKDEFSLFVDSEYYGFGSGFRFNFHGKDFKSKERDYDLCEAFIRPLAFYRSYIGKDIMLDIDFANETYYGSPREFIEARNTYIDTYRQKYLPTIRGYIKDTVDSELYEESVDYGKYKEYETLNQDGKLIRI